MITKQVSWGDAIVVELFRTPGGLKAVVDAIIEEVGPTVGTRNTFAKLLRVEDPEAMSDKDKWRAWLLLVALHQDPNEWGIGDAPIPRSLDADMLMTRLHESAPSRTRTYDLRIKSP